MRNFGYKTQWWCFRFKTKQLRNQNVNGYIVYDLDNLPKISLNNFKLKKFLFGLRNIVKKRLITVSMYVVTIEQHSMEQVDGVLVMSLIGML